MNLKLFMKASRFQVVPVMAIPVFIGTAGAFAWNNTFHLGWFLVTLVGALAMHLFSNMINDLWDYKNDVDPTLAGHEVEGISTNSGVLLNGTMTLAQFRSLTWTLFGVALISGIILTIFRGPLVFVYGLLGALLAYFYVAPPIRYGYRGKGYSEVSILISFGILPVLGSYYVQAQQFDYRAVLASLPIGLLTTLILFNHHFLHWKADKLAGKKTLVVVLGEQKALKVSQGILLLAYISLVAATLFDALPIYALIAIVTYFPAKKIYAQLKETNPAMAYLPLMKASLGASMQCGLILTLALLLQGIFQ